MNVMRYLSGGRPRRRVPVLAGIVAAASVCVLALVSAPAIAGPVPGQPETVQAATEPVAVHHTPGGEVNLKLPSLEQGEFFGLNGHQLLDVRPGRVRARPALRPAHLHPRPEAARAPVDGGNQRTDLPDLQDLPGEAGQVPPDSRAVHRVDHRRLLRHDRAGSLQDRHHPDLQPDWNRRQLRRGVVRHPHQHAGELADGLREPEGQAVPGPRDSAARGDERRA